MSHDLPAEGFDCIASLATLHHLPLREILLKNESGAEARGSSADSRSVRTEAKPG